MKTISMIAAVAALSVLTACDLRVGQSTTPTSTSGVSKATINIKPTFQFEGRAVTAEQFNIMTRQKRANTVGSIKHLYVVSAFSGDVIIYSTVKGKVTSSGKRLTPKLVTAQDGQYVSNAHNGIPVDIGGMTYYTSEVLQDDGSYGSSNAYLYWVDARGAGHEQYVTGGTFVHVSDVPMNFPKIILNLENTAVEGK